MRKVGDGKGRNGGGRKKGTPNKKTAKMRELLTNFCSETFDDFVSSYKRITEPEKKCKIWLEAQAYVTPKLSSIDMKADIDKRTFTDELKEIVGEKK